MAHFLSEESSARVLVVAGFHTGRPKVVGFFDKVNDAGFEVESIEEVDVNGKSRAWLGLNEDGEENVTERKRWLVVAVLRRRR